MADLPASGKDDWECYPECADLPDGGSMSFFGAEIERIEQCVGVVAAAFIVVSAVLLALLSRKRASWRTKDGGIECQSPVIHSIFILVLPAALVVLDVWVVLTTWSMHDGSTRWVWIGRTLGPIMLVPLVALFLWMTFRLSQSRGIRMATIRLDESGLMYWYLSRDPVSLKWSNVTDVWSNHPGSSIVGAKVWMASNDSRNSELELHPSVLWIDPVLLMDLIDQYRNNS